MPKDYLNQPVTAVRRSDRAITDDQWIVRFLADAPTGVFAYVHNNQPFVNTNLFVYAPARHAIYFHTANVGRTPAVIGLNGRYICFTAFNMGRLLPAAEALEFSVEYASVVAYGTARIVTDPAEAKEGLQALLDKYAPHLQPDKDYRGITPDELKRTAVYKLTIDEWVGKRKAVATDFPGAYYFDDVHHTNR
ncbi:MAG: 5-nitroimidazole antibiotic resistance protein NimA [Candidatus Promineifilaceae bacterium]